jgi:protease-4
MLVSSLLLFASLVFLVGGLIVLQREREVQVPEGCALVLAPQGRILEKESSLTPFTTLLQFLNSEDIPRELLLQDILSGIRAAARDERIQLLVLNPGMLQQAGLNQLHDIAQAIEEFRASGKRVIAFADTLSQGQYYLAAQSDAVYLNPMGSVVLRGFGVFRLYMRDLLDNLAVNFHVFQVGSVKSAAEPFMRNSMSPEVQEDTKGWLTQLWKAYCEDIAQQRKIPSVRINETINHLARHLEQAGGDPAVMAQQQGLIDGLWTQEEMRKALQDIVGYNDSKSTFKQISFSRYLSTLALDYKDPLQEQERVAIVVAQGAIVYGEGGEGQIGSASLTRQLRKIREDQHIKALVLRIDSPGGSAFASEMIRQELLLMQEAGKPVVVSMGATAASGAYWLAAPADRIFASPNTLTGSIGVIGMIPSFEKSFAKVGLVNDGIGTTQLADLGYASRAVPSEFLSSMQVHINQIYRRFLEIVAQGRKLPMSQVEYVAQGKVWDGERAVEMGLVDALGSLDDAVAAATELVGLPSHQAAYLPEHEHPAEVLLRRLGGPRSSLNYQQQLWQWFFGSTSSSDVFLQGDPHNIYSHSLLPPADFTF